MKLYRIWFTGLLLLAFFISGQAQTPCKDFEIVESIPIETILDNPEIRNTPEVWVKCSPQLKRRSMSNSFTFPTSPTSCSNRLSNPLRKLPGAAFRFASSPTTVWPGLTRNPGASRTGEEYRRPPHQGFQQEWRSSARQILYH
jgi:hypothetical protein